MKLFYYILSYILFNIFTISSWLISFLESFTSVGESIRKTQDVYEQAFSRLKSGNGNLIAQTMKLKELGVKSRKGSKEIPQELADGAEPES